MGDDGPTVPDVPALIDRLPPQYFAGILATVAAERAKPGPRVIDLGRGNPDLPPPPEAVEAVRVAALETGTPAVHGYPPFQGTPELKAALAARYAADHGVTLDPETEIAIVPGAKTGIMLLTLATAADGDRVLVPDPGYPDYASGVALAGGVHTPLPLEASAGFQPDMDAAPAAALALLNYPSNPCAVLEHPGTFEAAVAWAHRKGGWLCHDIAYGHLAFDGRRSRSVLEVDGARDVAVELWSSSKRYGMAGWRIGAVLGAAGLVARVKTLVDHLTAGVWTGLQRGLTAALTGDQRTVAEACATYEARRDRIVGRLRAAGADVAVPEGSFYAWWGLPEDLPADRLLREARVSVAPGDGFGGRGAGWARLSLATPDADLDEATDRLVAHL